MDARGAGHLREITRGIRRDAPGLRIGVRVSIFDVLPYHSPEDREAAGVPEEISAGASYTYGFGVDPDHPTHPDLKIPRAPA